MAQLPTSKTDTATHRPAQPSISPEPVRGSNLAQQRNYQYDLQAQRAQKVEDAAFENIAADIHPPKKGKYIFAGILAITGDLLDLLDITGIGEIVTLIADLIIDPLLTWLGFRMNKALKKQEQASESINGIISNLHQQIEGYRNAYQMAQTARSKLAGLKRSGRKTSVKLRLKKPTAVKKRGILGKIFLGQLIDFIPVAELYPARTHSVWSAYRAEKAAYQEAQRIIQDCIIARTIKIEEKNEYLEALQEQSLEEESISLRPAA